MAVQASAHEIAEQVSPLLRRMCDGRDEMLCPRCRNWADVLAFKSLSMMERFADHLHPIVKCGNCSHAFAPRFLSAVRVPSLPDDGLDELGSTVS